MVRLLRKARVAGKGTIEFQSHNGAIAADPQAFRQARQAMFQSHNGAIAAKFLVISACNVQQFQSHNGAIAAARL